jgi:Uma2 family endonuclease
VASPSNSEAKILQKISIYLANGVRSVWLVRPGPRTVTIFRPDGPEVILAGDQALDGGDILPGFRLPLARLFRLLDETAS